MCISPLEDGTVISCFLVKRLKFLKLDAQFKVNVPHKFRTENRKFYLHRYISLRHNALTTKQSIGHLVELSYEGTKSCENGNQNYVSATLRSN